MNLPRNGQDIGQFKWLTPAPALYHIPLPGRGRLAITITDLRWVDEDGTPRELLRGFPTDGVSFPWVARASGLDPWGRHLRSALPHDAGYSLRDYVGFSFGDKQQVDRRFLIGGLVDDPGNARLYYRAVSLFGRGSWNRDNAPLVDGYVFACRQGLNDPWIDFVRTGKVLDLRPA